MHARNLNPLTATVAAILAPSGLVAASVDSGYGEARIYPGYLSEPDAIAAGARFAEAIGRRAIVPADFEPEPIRARDYRETVAAIRETSDRIARARGRHDGRRGDDRRRQRRLVRAAKHSFIDSRD